jgi:hypothetical protein
MTSRLYLTVRAQSSPHTLRHPLCPSLTFGHSPRTPTTSELNLSLLDTKLRHSILPDLTQKANMRYEKSSSTRRCGVGMKFPKKGEPVSKTTTKTTTSTTRRLRATLLLSLRPQPPLLLSPLPSRLLRTRPVVTSMEDVKRRAAIRARSGMMEYQVSLTYLQLTVWTRKSFYSVSVRRRISRSCGHVFTHSPILLNGPEKVQKSW